MRVVLLGTGSADGWPNPFCGCASCAAVRGTPDVRGQTAVLVDGTLLLDCGPDAPRAAARLGVPLDGVRHLLLTHAHPDHVGPAALLWRRWASASVPLDVAGPAPALDLCRDWVGPDDPVRWRPVTAGSSLRLGSYAVRALPAAHDGEALLWDVTGPSGSRLLYATDTGPLPAATLSLVAGAAYGLVLLEETFGTAPEHGTAHLDLSTFPLVLAALRRVGAVLPGTRVVAVHLGHRNPPPTELAARLAAWGASLCRDGSVLDVPDRPVPVAPPTGTGPGTGTGDGSADGSAASSGADDVAGPDAGTGPDAGGGRGTGASSRADAAAGPDAGTGPAAVGGPDASGGSELGSWHRPHRTLVLGGARSGKSSWAEASLRASPEVTYVATAPFYPDDPEWTERIALHRARRPAAWRTVETADVAGVLGSATVPVLVDDVGNWLTVALDRAGVWSDPSALPAVRAEADELVAAWRGARVPVIAVSNEVGSGVVPATPAGRLFRDELGRLNARLAAESDEVVLLVAGLPVPLRSVPGGTGGPAGRPGPVGYRPGPAPTSGDRA